MMNLKGIIATTGAILLSCVVSVEQASATLIADYQFTGFGEFFSSDADAATTASDLSAGAGANLSTSSFGNPPRSLNLAGNLTEADEAAAIVAGDYYAFSITPGSDPLNLDSLTFDFQRTVPANGVQSYTLRTDAGGDNFGTQLLAGSIIGATGGAADFFPHSENLSTIGLLQGLTAATELRLYLFGADTVSPSTSRLDNLQLNGTSIPEPSSLAILMLGSVGATMLRRRKK